MTTLGIKGTFTHLQRKLDEEFLNSTEGIVT
jgi:hypothetical protein